MIGHISIAQKKAHGYHQRNDALQLMSEIEKKRILLVTICARLKFCLIVKRCFISRQDLLCVLEIRSLFCLLVKR